MAKFKIEESDLPIQGWSSPLPLLRDRLHEPDREEALLATLYFSLELFWRFKSYDDFGRDLAHESIVFDKLLRASPTVTRLLEFNAPVRAVAELLEQLAFARFIQNQRKHPTLYNDEPVDRFIGLTSKDLDSLIEANEGVAASLRDWGRDARPSDQKEFNKRAKDFDRANSTLRDARARLRPLEKVWQRERGNPPSPLRWIAEGVDDLYWTTRGPDSFGDSKQRAARDSMTAELLTDV